ncbi:NADP-dependent glyceraldehyde-3-phosphate dehydrogenase [Ureaplasma ceti]|uniref:NADP-dependent glyceraldehyde-3-phosphate dehydrogenase n=1 Tax=Ureaplasma ceti TaxID=3119530 RepID=A0ABP9U9Q8_9BACT
MLNFSILVDGALVDSDEKISVMNPTTNTVAGTLPLFEPKALVDTALAAANEAYIDWKVTSPKERIDLLLKVKELFLQHQEELADILVLEIAKSKKDSLTEIVRTCEYIDATIESYNEIMANPLIIDENTHHIKGKTGIFSREPLGVVVAIAPFNYPFNLLMAKLAPALVAGNTVVYKPASQGSLIGARVSQLFHEAGFPKGVVNCVVGSGRSIGDLLVEDGRVAMISFTGSDTVGLRIAEKAKGIPLVLEMGGKDPAIVMEDANLELAANEIIKGGFSYNGQRCTAIKRVFVHKSVHDELVKLLVEKVQKLSVGLPQDNAFITPLISNKAADFVQGLVDDAIAEGAVCLTEMKRERNLMWPMLVDQVTVDMDLAWEEPFGPVIPVITYDDLTICVENVNASKYGLQASVFTEDMVKAEEVANLIEAGTVNINRSSSRGPDIFPFSGVKNSGLGVQGIKDALISMTRVKGIVFNK